MFALSSGSAWVPGRAHAAEQMAPGVPFDLKLYPPLEPGEITRVSLEKLTDRSI